METVTRKPTSWTSLLPVEVRELDSTQRRIILAIALGGCLLRFFFWFYTGRVWGDASITVLHSENFSLGLGLTHHRPGYPPLHGFTSPLSVLVPLLAGVFHAGWGLPFQQIISALISMPTVLLAAAIALHRTFRLNFWLVVLLCAYLALEHHRILWGMAGMETQMAVFALFFAMYCAGKDGLCAVGASMTLDIQRYIEMPVRMAIGENLTLQHMAFLQTKYSLEKTFRSDPVHTSGVFRAGNNIDLTFVLLKKKSRP